MKEWCRCFCLYTVIAKVKKTLVLVLCFEVAVVVPSSGHEAKACCGEDCDCGAHVTNQFFIQEYSYTVSTYSLRLRRLTGSGTILDENWILVTASQLYNNSAYDIVIRAGSDFGTVGGQYSRVAKVVTGFTESHKVDIALLKTQDKLIFNKRVQPINIAEFVPQQGSKAMLSGFGKKESRCGELNAAQFEIISAEICKWQHNVDTVFCADAFESQLEVDDLGDPLVQENELVGIFVGPPGVWPNAFIPVAEWREHIIKAMKDNSAVNQDPDKINDSYYEDMDKDS